MRNKKNINNFWCELTGSYSVFSGKIDVLYLDNTYCSPACSFPSRDEATSEIIDIIQSHTEHDVIIGLRSLGKETLLCKIALTFQEWISVPSKFYETLKLLSAPNVFENNAADCRIRVEPFHKISNTFIDRLNQTTKTIAILPTAIYCGIDARPFENNDNVFVVPYSDHSSYTELMQFVSFLKPCKILPVVSGSARGPFGVSVMDRADMSRFDKYLNTRVTNACDPIPDTVVRHMKGRAFVPLENLKQGMKRKAKKQLRHGPVKNAKKGIEYKDSPEKTNQKQNVNNEADRNEHDMVMSEAADKENDTAEVLDSTRVNKSSGDTVVDDLTDSLKLGSSQGFIVTGDFNSDNEETVTVVELKLESGAPIQDNTGKLYTPFKKSIYSQGYMVTEDFNSDKEEIVTSLESEFECRPSIADCEGKFYTDIKKSDYFSANCHIDKNTVKSKDTIHRVKKKIRRSLEFASLGQEKHKSFNIRKIAPSRSVPEDKICRASSHDAVRESWISSESNNNTEKLDQIDDDDSEIQLVSYSEERAKEDENCESLSILNGPVHDNKDAEGNRTREDKNENNVLNTAKESHRKCSNKEQFHHCENVNDGETAVEDSVIMIDDVKMLSSVNSLIIISDSENTSKADSQTEEKDKLNRIDVLFNDTTLLDDIHSSPDLEQSDAIVSANIQSEVKVTTENSKSYPIIKSTNGYCSPTLALRDNQLRVVKWQPNMKNIRKQKFHESLTRFVNGIR